MEMAQIDVTNEHISGTRIVDGRISETKDLKRKLSVDETLEEGSEQAELSREGTFIGSFGNMTMSACGLGVLGLSQNFAKGGIIASVFFTVFFALATDATLLMLAKTAKRSGNYTYEKLCTFYVGFWGERIANWSLGLSLFMVIVAFITIPMETAETMLYEKVTIGGASLPKFECLKNGTLEDPPSISTLTRCVADNETTACVGDKSCYFTGSAIAMSKCSGGYEDCYCAKDSFILFNRGFIGVFMASFFGALGLVASLAKLSKVSTVSFICLFTSLILVMIELIRMDKAPDASDSSSEESDIGSTFLVIGILLLAYQCQFNLLQTYYEMKQPERIDLLCHLVVLGVAMPMYLTLGLAPVLCLGKDVALKKDNVVDALGDSPMALIAKALVVVMAVTKGPLVFNPTRDIIMLELRLIPGLKWVTQTSLLHRAVTSVIMAVSCYLLALILPLGKVMGLTGTLCATSSFCLPGLFFISDALMYGSESGEKREWSGWFDMTGLTPSYKRRVYFGWSMFVLGILGTILSVYGAYDTFQNPPTDCSSDDFYRRIFF